MNKKKLLTLAMALAMVAILAIGGTIAYFTDTDYNENVMVTGNVKIDQIEYQRNPEGGLEYFADGKLLVPAVFWNEDGSYNENSIDGKFGDATVPTWGVGETGLAGSGKVLDQSITNEVDKIVTVKNDGDRPVWIRTIFLMEDVVVDEEAQVESGKYLTDHIVFMWENSGNGETGYYNVLKDGNGDKILVEVNGQTYSVQTHYYAKELAADTESAPSLKQFYMDPDATNEIVESIGEDKEYKILALSQAVQSEGFADDRVALNAAFGEVNAENVKEWFEGKYTESKDLSAEPAPAA